MSNKHTYVTLAILLGGSLTACSSAGQSTASNPSPVRSLTATSINVTATTAPTLSNDAPAIVPVNSSLIIAKALQKHLLEIQQKATVVIGVAAIEGDYAGAIAQPHGEKTMYAFLRRSPEGWEVLEATSIPAAKLLKQKGIPEQLWQSSAAWDIVGTWAAQLQDPRSQGLAGAIVVEGIAGDYARGLFSPADPTRFSGFTAFFKRENGAWRQITAGSAFTPETLQQLGVPPALWLGH